MEACYGGTDVMERSCAMARGKDINTINTNQFPSFKVDRRSFKDSHTRIKGLALTNGHGRYIAATPERTLVSVGEWSLKHITVINL
jgi:hypothetical protein